MSAKRRAPSRKRKASNESLTAWQQYVNTGTAKNLAIVAAAVTAMFYINTNVIRPIYDSGPLPVPSRAEVDKLRSEVTATFDGVNKGVANTLEVAKAARAEAQQAVTASNDARVTRLTQQKLQLEATLKMMPGDPVFTDLLARTTQELARLSSTPVQGVPQVSLPATETK